MRLRPALALLLSACAPVVAPPLDASPASPDAALLDAAVLGDAARLEDDASSFDGGRDAGPEPDGGWDCRFSAAGFRCCSGQDEVDAICVGPRVWACPAASTAHVMAATDRCGDAREAIVEEGVRCSDSAGPTVCPIGEQCWESIATLCIATEHPTYYRSFWCDGPEDCAGGHCCLAELPVNPGTTSPTHLRSGCEPSECPAETLTMCATEGECTDGQRCCAGPRSDMGVCRALCFE
jgi:hypothetical protein